MSTLLDRKIKSVMDRGFVKMEGATVLIDKDGYVAIVNDGGAFYWADTSSLAWEYNRINKTNSNTI